MRKQVLNLTLGGRTGTVTVSPFSTGFLLCGRNGFLQLYHRDGEVTTSTALPCELRTMSQNLAPPCPPWKERTKSGAHGPLQSPSLGVIPAQLSGLSQQLMGNATSQSRSQSLLQHPIINKWFPNCWSNLSFMFQFRNYEQDSPVLS